MRKAGSRSLLRVLAGIILGAGVATLPGGAPAALGPPPDPRVIAAFHALEEYIDEALEDVLKKGRHTSLEKKLENAEAAYRRGQPCVATKILEAYLHETQALNRGKRLDTAEDLYRRGWLLRYELLADLPAGQACPSDPTFLVDPTVTPRLPELPEGDGMPARPLASVVDENRYQTDFVANELVLVTDDPGTLAAFLDRWGGDILLTLDPGVYGLTDMTLQYLVRINTDLADVSHLEVDERVLNPNPAGGTYRVSSEAGLRLLAAAAGEAAAGLSIGVNWVGRPAGFRDRSTSEAPTADSSADGFNSGSPTYVGNAYDWHHLNSGSTQDIGVTEAWTLLDLGGRLRNRVSIAIVDEGFCVTDPDLPPGGLTISVWAAIRPPLCGPAVDRSAPDFAWHGADVSDAAMAVPDNAFGAAGPAGPVAIPITVLTGYDYFRELVGIPAAFDAGARIINMSFGSAIGAGLSWSLIPFNNLTAGLHSRGVLLFASAGNDHYYVDELDCFIVCWEEAWVVPCENDGVICVGALARDSRDRAGYSNFGGDVDIFAPGDVLVAPNPLRLGTPSIPLTHAFSGTSAASPYAAGVAALIWAANPGLAAAEVEDIFFRTAHVPSPSYRITDRTVNRIVNAYEAVRTALPAFIEITAPADGSSIPRGRTLALRAFVHEAGHGAPSVTWSSDVEGGVIADGTNAYRTDLRFGRHTITATAAFPDGFTVSDTVRVTITNDPPTVAIASPGDLDTFFQSQSITFLGTSSDPNNVESSFRLYDHQVSWHLDGSPVAFATGHHPTTVLPGPASPGVHRITFRGTDGFVTVEASINVNIVTDPLDLPPGVRIARPSDGAIFTADQDDPTFGPFIRVALLGEVTDDGGPLPADSLVWTDSVNGVRPVEIGRGASLTVNLYAPNNTNTHQITLTATDSAGNTSSDTITLIVDRLY